MNHSDTVHIPTDLARKIIDALNTASVRARSPAELDSTRALAVALQRAIFATEAGDPHG